MRHLSACETAYDGLHLGLKIRTVHEILWADAGKAGGFLLLANAGAYASNHFGFMAVPGPRLLFGFACAPKFLLRRPRSRRSRTVFIVKNSTFHFVEISV